MDNLKPKKIKQVNLRDFLKIGGFSSASIILFFIPIANKKVSLIYILADLIYLKCEKFVYFCLIVFIIILGCKEYFNKEKNVFTKLNIVLKAICVFILIILITRNELIFLKNYTLIKILKCMIFKITILFPVSAFF